MLLPCDWIVQSLSLAATGVHVLSFIETSVQVLSLTLTGVHVFSSSGTGDQLSPSTWPSATIVANAVTAIFPLNVALACADTSALPSMLATAFLTIIASI